MVSNKNFYQSVVRFADTRHGQKVLGGVAIAIFVVAASIGGYYWHRSSVNGRAQEAFMDSVTEFEQALVGQEGITWSDAERTFDAGARTFSNSLYAPYFDAFKADTSVYQGKQADATQAMRDALAKMSPSNPLYFLYSTKLALVLIDSKEASVHDEGLTSLKTLAENSLNSYRDMALYYLGLYGRATDDQEMVQRYWSKLVNEFGADSVWAAQVYQHSDFSA